MRRWASRLLRSPWAQDPELTPVDGSEFVLRTIPNLPNFIRPDLPQPVTRVAFGPNKNDTDGLSVFREKFISPEDLARVSRQKGNCYVVRLRASDVFALGLTIKPDRSDAIHGHCLIREITYAERKVEAVKTAVLRLAQLAGSGIAFRPELPKS